MVEHNNSLSIEDFSPPEFQNGDAYTSSSQPGNGKDLLHHKTAAECERYLWSKVCDDGNQGIAQSMLKNDSKKFIQKNLKKLLTNLFFML